MFVFKVVFRNPALKLRNFQQIRSIPRWASRTPKKVYLPEEMKNEIDMQAIPNENKIDSIKTDYPSNFSFKSKNKKPDEKISTLRKMNKTEKPKTDMLQTVIDSEGNLVYTKMSDNDSRVAKILSNMKTSKLLTKQKNFLVEGKRLIKEALEARCKLQYILFSRKNDVEDLKPYLPSLGALLYKLPYKEMQLWSDLTTNPGIMGIFKIPDVIETNYTLPVNIICDNIREPGNLGSILRTCAGVGCKTIILTKGCCDIWNSKVLRGAMGAHFKVRVEKMDWENIGENIKSTSWFIADNSLLKTQNISSDIINIINNIPMEAYHNLKYTGNNEISLIIGGETEGISQEAYNFVYSKGGLRVNIPLENNVESLNSSTALGILLFEIRRQIKN